MKKSVIQLANRSALLAVGVFGFLVFHDLTMPSISNNRFTETPFILSTIHYLVASLVFFAFFFGAQFFGGRFRNGDVTLNPIFATYVIGCLVVFMVGGVLAASYRILSFIRGGILSICLWSALMLCFMRIKYYLTRHNHRLKTDRRGDYRLNGK